MAQTLFMDMLPGILVDMPECPTATAEYAVKKAAIDFFRDTGAWRDDLVRLKMLDGLLRYPLSLPECTQLLMVEDLIKDDGKGFTGPNWTIRLPNTLIFQSQPEVNLNLTPSALLMPSQGASGIPCSLDRWIPELEHGAKAILFAQPKKPWSDPQLAIFHRDIFRSAIANTRIALNTGHRAGDLAVTPRRWL